MFNATGRQQGERNISARTIKIGVGILLFLIVLWLQPYTFKYIDAGSVGVRVNLAGSDRGVDDLTTVTGRAWYNEWTAKIVQFPTYTQTVRHGKMTITAKDNTEFTIDPRHTFSIDKARVPYMYMQYRKPLDELKKTVLYNKVLDAYIRVANKYTSDNLMSNRERFEVEVEAILNKELNKEGFIGNELVSGLVPPEGMRDMIKRKNESVQAKMAAENEALEAESQAKVRIAKATGEATAKIIEAKADAQVMALKKENLSDKQLLQEFIRAWEAGGSQVPQTNMGGGSPFNIMMNMMGKTK